MSLLTEVLIIGGVAMDLVGAGVLSHAHNAESIVHIREKIEGDGAALGERDGLSTHAQLLAEKRAGFLILTAGLILYLAGLVLKSPEGAVSMGMVAGAIVVVGVAGTVVFTRLAGRRVKKKARRVKDGEERDDLPEQ